MVSWIRKRKKIKTIPNIALHEENHGKYDKSVILRDTFSFLGASPIIIIAFFFKIVPFLCAVTIIDVFFNNSMNIPKESINKSLLSHK